MIVHSAKRRFFSNKKNNKKIDCLVQLNGTGLHGLHHGLHDGTGGGLAEDHSTARVRRQIFFNNKKIDCLV